jgi:nicotinate-nucleotide adenylyltransferase
MSERKVILFGGTFDPIHLGHTGVAQTAQRHIGADKLIFIPAKRSPLKSIFPKAGDEARLAMIALAISGYPQFDLSDYELRKSAPSFTLETVMHFQTEYGKQTSIYWLLGADSIDDLVHWHRIVELIDRCNVAVMCRAGCNAPDFDKFEAVWGENRVRKLRRNIVPTPSIDISSTQVRHRLAAGEDVSGLLHPAVADYIARHNLYR